MALRKSMSFIRHSTFRGASGMELSTFFSCTWICGWLRIKG